MKSGVKILGASPSSPNWTVEIDINTKNTVALFIARRKDSMPRVPSA